MTITDVKVSTDPDGTEHWEHRIWPTGALEALYDSDAHGITPPGWEVQYFDAAALAPSGLLTTGELASSFRRISSATLVYWDAFDTTLPRGARLTEYRFDWSYARSSPDPTGGVTMSVDLWSGPIDYMRPTALQTAQIQTLVTTAPTTRLIPDIDVSALVVDEIHQDANVLESALFETVRDEPFEIGVRFGTYPHPIHTGNADYFEEIQIREISSDGSATHGPRFVIAYTLPGTNAPQPKIQQPQFHNAKRVLAAHRQHGWIVGRRPF